MANLVMTIQRYKDTMKLNICKLSRIVFAAICSLNEARGYPPAQPWDEQPQEQRDYYMDFTLAILQGKNAKTQEAQLALGVIHGSKDYLESSLLGMLPTATDRSTGPVGHVGHVGEPGPVGPTDSEGAPATGGVEGATGPVDSGAAPEQSGSEASASDASGTDATAQ